MKTMKCGLVVGAVVACAILQGCKAPKAQHERYMGRKQAAPAAQPAPAVYVEPAPAAQPAPAPVAYVEPAPVAVTVAPVAPPPPPPPPPAPAPAADAEYTVYTVRNGDYLAKISKQYNIRQGAILAANPGLKADLLYVGRKIRLPGRVEVKEAPVATKPAPMPKGAVPAPAAGRRGARAAYAPYTGATKEYVVKNGDFLGKIAAVNGVSVRALKEMNGFSNNTLRVGQKIKVPAEPVKAAAKDAAPTADKPAAKTETPAAPAPEKKAEPVKQPEPPKAAEAPAAPAPEKKAEPVKQPEPPKAAEAPKPAPGAPVVHTVKDGEDLFTIALNYSVSPSALKDLNDLSDAEAEKLPAGKVLKIPAGAKAQ